MSPFMSMSDEYLKYLKCVFSTDTLDVEQIFFHPPPKKRYYDKEKLVTIKPRHAVEAQVYTDALIIKKKLLKHLYQRCVPVINCGLTCLTAPPVNNIVTTPPRWSVWRNG